MVNLTNNEYILRACAALVDVALLLPEERRLIEGVAPLAGKNAHEIQAGLLQGEDVLGDAYMRVNSVEDRRLHGETYTPEQIVKDMIELARNTRNPGRIIDAGCGSGRFSLACAQIFPEASIVAVDASPMATLMCKASVCALGLQGRVKVVLGDFTQVELPACEGALPTLWIGNPPYVRHHDISRESKRWFADASAALGVKASGLSGLHAHFVVSIASRMAEGDFGVLVTSAEWLDVKYGSAVRELLANRMGLFDLRVHDKATRSFAGVDTTAVIFAFDERLASRPDRSVLLSAAGESGVARCVTVSELNSCDKWSNLLSDSTRRKRPEGYVRLGDFARVHRGIVTGANKFWVRKSNAGAVEKFTIPVVSHAREIMTGDLSVSPQGLSRLVVLPEDLDGLDAADAENVRSFMEEGVELGVDQGYVARSRRRWWSIPIGEPATILMTYMARRAPVFVANPQKVRALNVVHGIYPEIELSDHAISELVDYLNISVVREAGRTYSGGLTKFEPREVEALWVPSPKMLEEGSWRS